MTNKEMYEKAKTLADSLTIQELEEERAKNKKYIDEHLRKEIDRLYNEMREANELDDVFYYALEIKRWNS